MRRGVALSFLAAAFTAEFLVCFREAARYADRNSITFAMLLGAALLNSTLSLTRLVLRSSITDTPRPKRIWYLSALFLALGTVVGNAALAATLPRLDAGVTSTLMQSQVFFVAAGGWIFLRETVGRSLILGALLAVGGVAVFALPNAGSQGLDVAGIMGGFITSACFAAMLVWTRGVINEIDPISLNSARLWLSVGAMALWPGLLADVRSMPLEAWGLALAAAAGGPFLARLFIMYALRQLTAAQSKLCTMSAPVFSFALVFVVHGTAPSLREIVGGLLILTGVLVPTLLAMRRMS